MMSIATKYPAGKITLVYAICGGAVVGVVFGLIILIIATIEAQYRTQMNLTEKTSFLEIFEYLQISAMIGSVLGFIPALLTALQVTMRGITKQTPRYLWQSFIIGAAITCILLLATVLVLALPAWINMISQKAMNMPLFTSMVSTSLVIAAVGGITSAILAYFVLPKTFNNL